MSPPNCAKAAPGMPRCAMARGIELGLRAFLEEGGFKGFTTTFEDLHGLKQLPGLAVAAAHGRGLRLRRGGRLEDLRAAARDEGDGRRAAGRHFLHGGLHLPSGPGRPSRPRLAHAGRSARPSPRASRRWKSIRSASAARKIRCAWCSTRPPGPALNAAIIDLGNRFRLLVNEVDVVEPRRSPCPSCRSPARYGNAGPISRRPARRGFMRRRAPHRLQLQRDDGADGGLRQDRRHRDRDHRRETPICASSASNCATTKSTTISRQGLTGASDPMSRLQRNQGRMLRGQRRPARATDWWTSPSAM